MSREKMQNVDYETKKAVGGEKALSKPPKDVLEPQLSRVVSKEMLLFIEAVGATGAGKLLSGLTKSAFEKLKNAPLGREGIRQVFKSAYDKALAVLQEAGGAAFAAEKAAAVASAAVGLAVSYYAATHDEWARWLGKHGGEIGRVIGETGGKVAEEAVQVGKKMAAGLKGYRNWADEMADKLLEKMVPGYKNLPEE